MRLGLRWWGWGPRRGRPSRSGAGGGAVHVGAGCRPPGGAAGRSWGCWPAETPRPRLPARRDAIWEVLRLSKSALDGLPLAPAPRAGDLPGDEPRRGDGGGLPDAGRHREDAPGRAPAALAGGPGVVPAGEVARVPNGGWLTVAGLVIARQRPESARASSS
ncbi:MAG: hypothetical protein R3F43_30845 [bacterium]